MALALRKPREVLRLGPNRNARVAARQGVTRARAPVLISRRNAFRQLAERNRGIRLVDQMFTDWNHVTLWLRQLYVLKEVASLRVEDLQGKHPRI